MAQFAPPIRRGDFLYSSILYADGGDENLHPRATISHLTALLRPEAPKKDKKLKVQRPPEILKDPKGHWYSAQLIHHGLPFTRDKNAAKVRLLDALNERRLEVPAWVDRLEKDMKKEWDAANRKLKKASAKGATATSSQPSPMSGGSAGGEQYQSPSQLSQRKRRRGNIDAGKADASNKKVKVKESASPHSSGTTQHTSNTVSSSPVKKEKPKTEPSSQRANPDPHDYYDDDYTPQDITFSGTYTITCPAISNFFGHSGLDDSLHLSLLRDEPRGVWWASFSWFAWDCIIQMNPGPSYQTLGQPCTLGWRLRDHETGRMHFGRGKTGTVVFHADQMIDGTLVNVPFLGAVEFWGRRIPGPRFVGRTGNGFQFEWDGFVNAAYRG
jgi:hypothetical protein